LPGTSTCVWKSFVTVLNKATFAVERAVGLLFKPISKWRTSSGGISIAGPPPRLTPIDLNAVANVA